MKIMRKIPHETGLILLVAFIQFVNILDFMMVLPLGPDFTRDLGIPATQTGLVGGVYSAAAAVTGVAGLFFLDRFDRKKAILWALAGLAVSTLISAFSLGLYSLMFSRILAGAFGGIVGALCFAIIADIVAPEKRGRAMGMVMGAFSMASIIGVPIGLEAARLLNWRLPFVAIFIFGLGSIWLMNRWLPSLASHLVESQDISPFARLKSALRLTLWPSYITTLLNAFGIFLIIPHISTYFQYNLGYPRASLGVLYFFGGLFSLAGTQASGRLVDKYGYSRVYIAVNLLLMIVLALGYIHQPIMIPAIIAFVGFMLCASMRGVVTKTLETRLPHLAERAGFMSLQSTLQNGAAAAGAMASGAYLVQTENLWLVGLDKLALCTVILSVVTIFSVWKTERTVRAASRRMNG